MLDTILWCLVLIGYVAFGIYLAVKIEDEDVG